MERRNRNIVSLLFKNYLFLLFFNFYNCTTIGFHNPSELKKYTFTEEISYKLCIIKEENITEDTVKNLVSNLHSELSLYNLSLETQIIGSMKRPGFSTSTIYDSIIKISLPENCDRIMVFFKRNFLDFISHIVLPEILGLVESSTRTRGYIFADYLSINILTGATPSRTLIHENYHFLGCDHHWKMNDCYKSIFNLREAYIENSNNPFFPTISHKNKILDSREKVNYIIKRINDDRVSNSN